MTHSLHCSDEELQAYADGIFAGDQTALSAHIDTCLACRAGLEAYREISGFARQSWAEPVLYLNLAEAVNKRIEVRRRAHRRSDKMLLVIAGLLACGIFIACSVRLLGRVSPGVLMLAAIAVGLYLRLSLNERLSADRCASGL